MYIMKTAGLSDVGQLRTNNEDNYTIEGSLLVVADGMGGTAGGEIASSIAIKTIPEKLKNISYTNDDEVADAVKQAVIDADTEIKNQTKENPDLKGMGTTVVLAIHFDSRFLIGNLGDSRAYLISKSAAGSMSSAGITPSTADANAQTAILEPIDIDFEKKAPGAITRLSKDHSVVMDLVNSGVITEEDIRTHPLRNRITRCVGSLREDGADVTWHDVNEDDILILCSDGLWELVHEDIILAVVGSSINLEEICKRLIDAANDAGGFDNITVIAGQFLKDN